MAKRKEIDEPNEDEGKRERERENGGTGPLLRECPYYE